MVDDLSIAYAPVARILGLHVILRAMSPWTTLLESAIHSPSPHNVQPWRVRLISDTEADLLIDSTRTLPKEDPTGSFIILTMGMFIEGLRLLAANHGFRLEHTTYHEPSWYALEINIAVETPLTIALRRLCLTNRELCERLFGRQTPPMVFQYNALDYIIETEPNAELVFTIGRQTSAAPKIRYNLRDFGGMMSHRELSTRLRNEGLAIEDLGTPQSCFPILFVFGRADLTAPFYGAKVYPTDLEDIINAHPVLVKKINSFQLPSYEDEELNRRLRIHLETVQGFEGGLHRTFAIYSLTGCALAIRTYGK